MRKVRAHLETTIDGVVEHPERWTFASFTPEMMEATQSGGFTTDTVLLGRRTYEQFAEVWPKRGDDVPFAQFLNETRKLVASNSSPPLPWRPAEILSGDVPAAVAELRTKPGGDVIVLGSVTLVGSLLQAGVLDVLELFLFPAVMGRGQRLFEGPTEIPGRLIDSRTFDNGVLLLRYAGRE